MPVSDYAIADDFMSEMADYELRLVSVNYDAIIFNKPSQVDVLISKYIFLKYDSSSFSR